MAANVDLTIARPYDDAGIRRRVIGSYTGPKSYTANAGSATAGGDPFFPGDVKNLGEIEYLSFEVAINPATPVALIARYSQRLNAVLWFDFAGNEIANATDLSLYACRFEAIGK